MREIGFVLTALFLHTTLHAEEVSPVTVGTSYGRTTVVLFGNTDSGASWRWLDVADQAYSSVFQASYTYETADVTLSYDSVGTTITGHLSATGLKPNFSYQMKLVGSFGNAGNDLLGYNGRWWQEQWDGSAWSNGQNLNEKGDGSSPNPNDLVYESRKDDTSVNSPTGLLYKYTGYRYFDYFVTDADGNAELDFVINASYHVTWKESQYPAGSNDGPTITYSFDVDPAVNAAYDTSHPTATESVYGEWERLPIGGIGLRPGDYDCQFVLTEESFHGSGLAGGWAFAMSGTVQFTVLEPAVDIPTIDVVPGVLTFADTVIGQSALQDVTIGNVGTATLNLTGVPPVSIVGDSAGVFSVSTQPGSVLLATEQETFSVTFAPSSVDTFTARLEILSNDPYGSLVTIPVTARGVTLQREDDDNGCGMSATGDTGLFWLITLLSLVILRVRVAFAD